MWLGISLNTRKYRILHVDSHACDHKQNSFLITSNIHAFPNSLIS